MYFVFGGILNEFSPPPQKLIPPSSIMTNPDCPPCSTPAFPQPPPQVSAAPCSSKSRSIQKPNSNWTRGGPRNRRYNTPSPTTLEERRASVH